MTDIEQRARDALNTLYAERHNTFPYYDAGDERLNNWVIETMCRALEAHDATKAEFEAFRRDVSDAVKDVALCDPDLAERHLSRFILPEPVDPLVEAISAAIGEYITPGAPWENLRNELAKRGGKIVWEQQP